MTPHASLELPHTVGESFDTLRAFGQRMADEVERFTAQFQPLTDSVERFTASLQPLTDSVERITASLQPLVEAAPRLTHKSCRRTAVVLPRWRRMRDRAALELLLAAVDGSGPTIVLGGTCTRTDKRTTDATESPPLADRCEPAWLRGPPAHHHTQMRGSVAAGISSLTGQSDSAAVRHTTASAWVLSLGGERTRH